MVWGWFTSQGRSLDGEQRSEARTTHPSGWALRGFLSFIRFSAPAFICAPLPGLDRCSGRGAISSSSSSMLFKTSAKKAADPSTWKNTHCEPQTQAENSVSTPSLRWGWIEATSVSQAQEPHSGEFRWEPVLLCREGTCL